MGYYKYDETEESKSPTRRRVQYVVFAIVFTAFGIHALLNLFSFLRLSRNEFDIDTVNMDPHFAMWYSLINFIVFTVLLLMGAWFLYKRKTVVVVILFVLCVILAVISGLIAYFHTSCC